MPGTEKPSATGQSHPNGTLIKSSDSATVYVIDDGKKRPVPSAEIFASHGYDFARVAVVSGSMLATFTDASGGLGFGAGTLIKGTNPEVYLVDSRGEKHHITSVENFLALGYNFNSVHALTDGDLASYTTGTALTNSHADGALIKYASSPTVYLVEGGTKRPIVAASIFEGRGYRWEDVATVSDSIIYTDGTTVSNRLSGTLVKYGSDPSVYVLDGTSKRAIPSLELFTAKGYSFGNVVTIPDDEVYTSGEPLS